MKTKKIEVRKKGLWSCPKCKKSHLGFIRGGLCPDCKIHLRFSAEEATLTTCQKCQNLFNFDKQKEVSPGARKCPRCKAVLNRAGKLSGKQTEGRTQPGKQSEGKGLHVEKIPGGGWRLRGNQLPVKRKEEELEKLSKFRGAKPRLPDSSSGCRLCGECGKCGKEKQKGAELDTAVRSYVLDYFARLHG